MQNCEFRIRGLMLDAWCSYFACGAQDSYCVKSKSKRFLIVSDKGRLTFFPAVFLVLFLDFFQVLCFFQLFIFQCHEVIIFFKIQDH